jgi:hypothetical protein
VATVGFVVSGFSVFEVEKPAGVTPVRRSSRRSVWVERGQADVELFVVYSMSLGEFLGFVEFVSGGLDRAAVDHVVVTGHAGRER